MRRRAGLFFLAPRKYVGLVGLLTLEDIQPMMMMVVSTQLRAQVSKGDDLDLLCCRRTRAEETSFEEQERKGLEED